MRNYQVVCCAVMTSRIVIRLGKEENKLRDQLRDLQNVRQELSSATARETSLQRDLERANQEQSELKSQLHAANDALDELKREAEAHKDR